MKLLRVSPCEVLSKPAWRFLDNCPACRLIKKAIIEGHGITLSEWNRAYLEALKQSFYRLN